MLRYARLVLACSTATTAAASWMNISERWTKLPSSLERNPVTLVSIKPQDPLAFSTWHPSSRSWVGGRNETNFQSTINAWRAAGIIPTFAVGNAGPACSSGNSPADLGGLIGVGSTTISNTLASSSSKRPALNELVKPDIFAPGADVRSTWVTGASDYVVASGTSMVAPHVSGVVALMLSARPSLIYDEVASALYSSADQSSLEQTGHTCGGTLGSVFPNNQYGHGRVNAFAAINRVLGVPPVVTPAPTSEPRVADRCSGLNDLFCSEFLCEWSGDTCSSWL